MIAETEQRARKHYNCCACSVIIPAGHGYVKVIEKDDCDDIAQSRWHVECREEFSKWLYETHDDCGDPCQTWENDMPGYIKQKYISGPFEESA